MKLIIIEKKESKTKEGNKVRIHRTAYRDSLDTHLKKKLHMEYGLSLVDEDFVEEKQVKK